MPTPHPAPHKVLLIDDHALFRRGLARLISMDEEFTVVGEVGSGSEGVELALRIRPDVVLIDLNMPDMSGIQTIDALKEQKINACFIILTVSNSEGDLLSALDAGAHGYLLKEMEPEDLCASLKRAVGGAYVIDDAVSSSVLRSVATKQRPPASYANLTAREVEVLDLLAEGHCNKIIARELCISLGTVKIHVKHVLAKLSLHSRLEAVVWRHAQQQIRH